jgi:Beta-lactamase enzyme family
MRRRPRLLVTSTAAAMAVALCATALPATSVASPATDGRGGVESQRLSAGMAAALRSAGFNELVDFNQTLGGVAQPASARPNVDLAVIELDRRGRVVSAADVLYDRDSPNGYQVKVDQRTLGTSGVQFSRWNADRYDDPARWAAGPDAADVLVQPGKVDKQYMVTYPASVLKLMVGFGVMRLVDQHKIQLTTPVMYHERGGQSCQYAPSNPRGLDPAPVAEGATDTVAGWLDQMVTVSDNFATCVLLQKIYDAGALDATNAYFHQLGLTTLVVQPEHPAVGAGWSTGHFSMGSLDTARLLLLVAGAKGPLWQAPDHRVVTADSGLTARSRRYFESVMAQQSFNEVLNPVNLCDSPDAVQGIPSTVPVRWVDPNTGDVVTYDGDETIDFGYDTRPCNANAEVRFAHKTGLVSFAGSDAGIVRALPGQDGRQYVISIQSSIGYRYGDPDWATSDPNACYDAPYVCYPRGFGRIGKAVDDLVKARPNHN